MIVEALWLGGALMLSYPLAGLHWLGYRRWVRATATVVRLDDDPNPSSESGPLYAPVLRFRTAGGEWVETVEALRARSRHKVGDQVPMGRRRAEAVSPTV